MFNAYVACTVRLWEKQMLYFTMQKEEEKEERIIGHLCDIVFEITFLHMSVNLYS